MPLVGIRRTGKGMVLSGAGHLQSARLCKQPCCRAPVLSNDTLIIVVSTASASRSRGRRHYMRNSGVIHLFV